MEKLIRWISQRSKRGGFQSDSLPRRGDRGGTVARENMESVMMNCVTEQFGISGRHEAGQPGDDGGGDDGGGSAQDISFKNLPRLTHLISLLYVTPSRSFRVLLRRGAKAKTRMSK